MTPEFRERLYQWRYDPSRDGSADTCIPLQLQRLFVRMQMSARAAVPTKELTRSFGWSNADSFRQHDVQELCRVLFDALERATAGYTLVNDLYSGTVVDFLECQTCRYKRTREDTFMDVELLVKGIPNAATSLATYTTPELLEGGNQWLCPECDAKVDALKGTCFATLPRILTLHLKRFIFDFELMRRVKVQDRFDFPATLDMGPYVSPEHRDKDKVSSKEGDGPLDVGGETEKAPPKLYDLFGIMIHSGTAMGGHYFAFIKPPASESWFEFNDSTIRPLSDADMAACFLGDSGDDDGGEGEADATEGDGAEACGKASGSTDENGLDDAYLDRKRRRAVAATSSNAYLLMYRKVEDDAANTKSRVAKAVPVPDELAEEVITENRADEKLRRAFEIRRRLSLLHVFTADGRRADLHLPNSETLEVATNAAYEQLFSAKGIEAARAEAIARAEAKAAAAAAANGDGAVGAGEEGESKGGCDSDCGGDGADDIEAAAAAVLALDDSVTSVARENVRLRRYVPGSRRPTDTFGGREDKSLFELGLAPSADLILEVRQSGEEWKEYNPNECVLRVQRWDREANELAVGPDMVASVTVPGELGATLGGLRAAVAEAFGIPLSLQRLVHQTQERCEVMVGDDKELRKDLHCWVSDDVIVEVIDADAGETAAGPSQAVAKFDVSRNVVVVQFNALLKPGEDPKKLMTVDYDLSVIANRRETLGEVKDRIAKALDVDPLDIHCRRNHNGARLKDETKTLRDLELVDGSILFIGRGACLKPDEHILRVHKYNPGAKPPFTHLLDTPAGENMKIGALKRRLADAVHVTNPACIRLRDKNGKRVGSIFRDNRSIGSLQRLSDGREIALQVLDEPEAMGPRDIVIAVRRWRPLESKLGPVREVVVPKATTTGQLRAVIRDKFNLGIRDEDSTRDDTTSADGATGGAGGNDAGEAAVSSASARQTALPQTPEEHEAVARAEREVPLAIGLAKKNDFGQVKVASLNWNAPDMLEDNVISARPLGLRDGSTLLVRDEREFALLAVRNPAKAKGKASKPGTTGRGRPGLPKPWERGAKRGGGGGGVMVAGTGAFGRAEVGISISTPFDSPKKESKPSDLSEAPSAGAPEAPASAVVEESDGKVPE